jgi:hypothetical protein
MERERAKPLEGRAAAAHVDCCVLCGCVLCCSRVHFLCGARENMTKKGEHDRWRQTELVSSWSVENLLFLSCVPEFWIPTVIYGVHNQATYYHATTCRQLGNDTTYDTEKKNTIT